MLERFAELTALVTGGSRGIGRAVALRLAREGADVAVTYATREQDALQVVDEIEGYGGRAIASLCDVARTADVLRTVERTRVELGPIDLLVHCGAIGDARPHEFLDEAAWRRTIDVNLSGTYRVIFAVKDEMIARRYGRIVTLASFAALRPSPFLIHEAAAKGGVIALTRGCAAAFGPFNVRCVVVAPGPVATEMANAWPEREIERLVPSGELPRPEAIAAVICDLLDERCSVENGETVEL